jgi:protein-disulfide isomerase
MPESLSLIQRVQRSAMLVLAVAGLLTCAARVAVAWFRPAVAGASCGPSSQSLAQEWGSRAGLDLFLGGLVFFAIVLLFELAPRLATGPSYASGRALVFILSIPVVAVVGRMAVTGLRTSGRLPLPLIILTVSSAGVFLLAAVSDTAPLRRLPSAIVADLKALSRSWRGRVALALTTLVLGLVAAFVGHQQWQARRAARTAREDFVKWFASQPRADSSFLQDQGSASIVIVKFNDYQCPPCRASFQAYGPLLKKYQASFPGRVSLTTMDFPLDSTCNPALKTAFHPMACEAAATMRLARRTGRDVRPLEEWLFAHQRELTRASIWEAAERLASVRFAQAEHDAALAEVKEDARRGVAVGVNSTPTFFINGVKVEGAPPADTLEALLDAELRRLRLARAE